MIVYWHILVISSLHSFNFHLRNNIRQRFIKFPGPFEKPFVSCCIESHQTDFWWPVMCVSLVHRNVRLELPSNSLWWIVKSSEMLSKGHWNTCSRSLQKVTDSMDSSPSAKTAKSRIKYHTTNFYSFSQEWLPTHYVKSRDIRVNNIPVILEI